MHIFIWFCRVFSMIFNLHFILSLNFLFSVDFSNAADKIACCRTAGQGKAKSFRQIWPYYLNISSVQFSCSVVSDSLQPHGLQHTRPPCPLQFPEFTQTHVHWVCDAIQPSHSLSSPSVLTFNLSQHQGLFKWISSSHQVAKVLRLQHKSFQWIFRTDFL